MPLLTDRLTLGHRQAPSRLVFGPHVTNLCRDRSLTERHAAYYGRRARGGAGLVVTETASIHPGDWPYERAPLAEECASGWRAIAAAVHEAGSLVVAGLGHAGGQGTSAYSQSALWAPSPVVQNNDREVPKEMEAGEVAAVRSGFVAAATAAMDAGIDGVEIDAGQASLLRQFLSGLTNQRDDAYGADRGRLLAEILAEVRAALDKGVLGLRLSCDELAPWAGITAETGARLAERFSPLVDYVVVVKGSIYSAWAVRPDGHQPPGFNLDLAREVRGAVGTRTALIAQGSIVDPEMAEDALSSGVCDAVEMTRAQIADADLGRKVAAGRRAQVRPCLLCNQRCAVRDGRNPIVSCVVDPDAGWEGVAPEVPPPATGRHYLVVGGGPSGLEAARVAVARGHRVTLAERRGALGGAARTVSALPGRNRFGLFLDWLEAECRAGGVEVLVNHQVTASEARAHDGPVLLGTGGVDAPSELLSEGGSVVLSGRAVLEVLAGGESLELPEGPAVVWDPLGGPQGIGLAELLARRGPVTLVTPDLIAGKDLAMSGDLAPANTRLQQAGVRLVRTAFPVGVAPGRVVVEDRYTGMRTELEAGFVVEAGYRVPAPELREAAGASIRMGDAEAPRTVYEAVLEARRAVLAAETANP